MSPRGEPADTYCVKQLKILFIWEKPKPPHPVDAAFMNGINVLVDNWWKRAVKFG